MGERKLREVAKERQVWWVSRQGRRQDRVPDQGRIRVELQVDVLVVGTKPH